MNTIMIQFVTAFFGSIGFCLVFNLRKKLILPAAIGSIFCWGIYLLGMELCESELIACLLAAAFSALYAELLARIKKAPATLFLLPTVVSVIPGSKLFYTMSSIVQKEWDKATEYALVTMESAFAIGIGISLVWAACVMCQNIALLNTNRNTGSRT